MTRRLLLRLSAAGMSLGLLGSGAQGRLLLAQTASPAKLTAEQDHQRTMDELGIKVLRHGAAGDASSPYAANYDESKANPYPQLPDPLILANGTRVTTPEQWWTIRRPKIIEMFDREIYGRAPVNTPTVRWEVMSTTREKNGDVAVITKKLVGHVDNSSYPAVSVAIDLTLTTPADAKGPVPVMLEIGMSPEMMAELMKRFPAASRPAPTPGGVRPVCTDQCAGG